MKTHILILPGFVVDPLLKSRSKKSINVKVGRSKDTIIEKDNISDFPVVG